MDISNYLKGELPEVWADVPGTEEIPKESRPQVLVAEISPEDADAIMKECTYDFFDGRTTQSKVDEDKFMEKMVEKVFKDWRNFEDGDKALPPTTENKVKMLNKWSNLYRLFSAVSHGRFKMRVAAKVAARKN